MQAPQAIKGCVLWVVGTKAGVPDVYTSFFQGDTSKLEHSRGNDAVHRLPDLWRGRQLAPSFVLNQELGS